MKDAIPSVARSRRNSSGHVAYGRSGRKRVRSWCRHTSGVIPGANSLFNASSLTRTGDPQLRRLLLYPTELWTRVGMIGFEPTISCSQRRPAPFPPGIKRDHLSQQFLNGQENCRVSVVIPFSLMLPSNRAFCKLQGVVQGVASFYRTRTEMLSTWHGKAGSASTAIALICMTVGSGKRT